jgi:hypothetical protein
MRKAVSWGMCGSSSGLRAVDALQDHDVLGGQLDHRPLNLPAAAEVVARQLDSFPGNQACQIVVEPVHVQRSQGFIVVFAGLVRGGLLAIDEETVQFQRDWGMPQGQQLDRKPLREGGLSGG